MAKLENAQPLFREICAGRSCLSLRRSKRAFVFSLRTMQSTDIVKKESNAGILVSDVSLDIFIFDIKNF